MLCLYLEHMDLPVPESVETLRQRIKFEGIARRLAAGQSPLQVARETNMRHEAIQALFDDPAFMSIMAEVDAELAEDIRAEREANKPLAYEERLLREADGAVQTLTTMRDTADNDTQRVAAARALVEIAGKVKAAAPEVTRRRVTFPATQLKSLLEAVKEVRALEEARLEYARHASSGT